MVVLQSVKCSVCGQWFETTAPVGATHCHDCSMRDEEARVACDVATPPALATALVARAELWPGARALEPSAGEGALVEALLTPWTVRVTACEFYAPHAEALRQLGAPPALTVREEDFLRVSPDAVGPFDGIVMSPPFRSGADPRADLAHVEHAYRFLAPGGRLVAVLHARLLDRDDPVFRDARTRWEERGAQIERLDAEAFGPRGPATLCLTVEKPAYFDHATFGRFVQEALPRWMQCLLAGSPATIARAAAWYFIRPVYGAISPRVRAAMRRGTVLEAVPQVFQHLPMREAHTFERGLLGNLLAKYPVTWEELELPED